MNVGGIIIIVLIVVVIVGVIIFFIVKQANCTKRLDKNITTITMDNRLTADQKASRIRLLRINNIGCGISKEEKNKLERDEAIYKCNTQVLSNKTNCINNAHDAYRNKQAKQQIQRIQHRRSSYGPYNPTTTTTWT